MVSIRGGYKGKGMPLLNGATLDRVILRARDYKLLFPCHPLSQIYPSTSVPTSRHRQDFHLPPSISAFFVFFNSQLCDRAASPFGWEPSHTIVLFLSACFLDPNAPPFSLADPRSNPRCPRRRPSSTIISPRKSCPPRSGNRFAFIPLLER